MILLTIFAAYSIALSIALAFAGHRSRTTSTSPTQSGPSPKRILIVGATGGTGRELVAQALERGYQVTALVRDPSKLGIEDRNLTLARGDVLDYASVEAAVRGQDAVVSALGHHRFLRPTRIQSMGTQNILNAMKTAGVSRFVCQTSLGIGNSAFRMGIPGTFFLLPVVLQFYFWDKARQEKIIAASDRDWIIVRPSALTNGSKRGSYKHGFDVGSYIWTPGISRADVADFMLNQLEQDTNLGCAAGVCG
jgi:putative NADH-flavin reductase